VAQRDILKVLDSSFIWDLCNEVINLVKRLCFSAP